MNTELFWWIRRRFDNVVCQKVIRQYGINLGLFWITEVTLGGSCVSKGDPKGEGGGVYCVPLQHCQSSGSLIPHKTWFQMSNTPWISNCLGRPTWFRFYAIGPSKDPQNGIGGANEAILGQQEFRKYQYIGSIMPYVRSNHPDGAFPDI